MRRRILVILLFLFLALSLLGVKVVILDRKIADYGALRVDSLPKTTVFLNGREVGQTPYEDEKLIAADYKVKLGTWETKIKISAGTLTYISRNIGPTEGQSSDQILILEKLASGNTTELTIVSSPDAARITLDGLDKGQAPSFIKDIAPGEHKLVLSLPGHSDQIIGAKTILGYRLNVIVKLAQQSSSGIPPVSSPSATPKPYVVVKDTPTGFLRVRTEASLTASEAGQVKPGEKYPLLFEIANWAKIQLATYSGWVSGEYVEKVK